MNNLSEKPLESIEQYKIVKCNDYLNGIDNLPKSDVLKYYLENGSSIVIRPSGTEPKLKVYISICTDKKEKASKTYSAIIDWISKKLNE